MIEYWQAILYPLGFLSSLAFGARFLVQWLYSEKAKRSIVPPIFWKLSLVGNILLFLHATFQSQLPVSLIQSCHSIFSWRNLNLLKSKEKQAPLSRVILMLIFGALGTLFLFFLMTSLFHQEDFFRTPAFFGFHIESLSYPLWFHIVGICGICLFSLRFWVQWWQAENDERLTLSPFFWWISLVGALISSSYFILIKDPVNLIGPLLAIIPYGRNLILIKREKQRQKSTPSFFILAGEKSGERLAHQVVEKLKSSFPHMQFFGVVGKEGASLIEPILEMEKLQAWGVSGVILRLPQLLFYYHKIKKEILKRAPIACLFIDVPDMSYKLAKSLKRQGFSGSLIQLVAPTVWAWRRGRADSFAKVFDLLLPLYSFEPAYFAHTTLKTRWVGHPLVETIANVERKKEPLLALFPGSRPEEVKRNFLLQLEAALIFCQKVPNFDVAVSFASYDFLPFMEGIVEEVKSKIPQDVKISFVPFEERYSLMKRASFALAKGGTCILELGLHKVPTVVMYQVSFLNRFLAKHIFRLTLPYFSLVNILKGKEVFSEYIREKPEASDLAASLFRYHDDEELRKRCERECRELFSLLQGEKSPKDAINEAIVELLNEKNSPVAKNFAK
jgi:lipid-A-disaccharide synthase